MKRNLLTPTEREVLALIGRGKTAIEIATILKMAKEAVEASVKSAAHKLAAVYAAHQQPKSGDDVNALETHEDKLRASQ